MLTGVIEGFYGRAWTRAQRHKMMGWIRDAGMNLYVYAPKDDIKLRARWREPYDAAELADLADLSAKARADGLEMMVAIAPCLDITHSDPADLACLMRRIDQFLALGLGDIALLFDDIPSTLAAADMAAFGSLALAQAHVANKARAHLAGRGNLYFCPTDYCAEFTGYDVPGSAYLNEIGARLHPDIAVFWTGPDIVSETIDLPSILEVGRVLRRKPFIWDNFHANDYDIRRVYAGPLAGRDPAILPHVSGWMTNPNNEFEANFVPVATTGLFLTGRGYDPANACSKAVALWAPHFHRDGNATDLPSLPVAQVQLLTDLCHQPFAFGAKEQALIALLGRVLQDQRPDPASLVFQTALSAVTDLHARTADLFDRMTELANRDLFYAFHPYLWEAREELRHLATYLRWLNDSPPPGARFPHRGRVYNFYRRGFTAALNDLWQRSPDAEFRHGG